MEGGGDMSVERTASRRGALAAGATVPRRALVAAALLSVLVLVALALLQALAGKHSPVAPAAHFRASAHLRSRASAQRKKGLSSLPLGAQGPISQALGAEEPGLPGARLSGRLSGGEPHAALQHRLWPLGCDAHLGFGSCRPEPQRRRLRQPR